MGYRKEHRDEITADLSILEVIKRFNPEALQEVKDGNLTGKFFAPNSDGTMQIRCPKPTHEDSNPSCKINLTDNEKYNANTGYCFGCPEDKYFTSLDLAIMWFEYERTGQLPPKKDKNYYYRVDEVVREFGLDKSKYCDSYDYRQENNYVPFFTNDELNALGIGRDFIAEQNRSNIVHQKVCLEDYVNFSLFVSGRSNTIIKTPISDYFHKDPKSKQFVYTDKYKKIDFDLDENKKLKTFLDEAKYLLTVHNSEYTGGKTFLDFTYRDIARSEAFEIYQSKKSLVSPALDKKMRTYMPTAMEAVNVFGKVAETEMKRKDGEKKAPEAQKNLHEALRHNFLLNEMTSEFGSFVLEDIVNRRYEVYYDNVTKKQENPSPAFCEDKYKSVFSVYGKRDYNDYTYSSVVLLDRQGMKCSCSAGTTAEKHFATSVDKYRPDFRYSTEQSNVPLFQSQDEFQKYYSVYEKLANICIAYENRYKQLEEAHSHTYFTVEGKPFVMPPPPEKLLRIARQDSEIISLVQQRNEILDNLKAEFKEKWQITEKCAGICVKALHAKAKTVPLKNGEMYSEYIESARDWWKKDTDFFESLVRDRIAEVREECERKIKESSAMKETVKSKLFSRMYSRGIDKRKEMLRFVNSAEEKLNALQGARGTTETKEATVEMPEQTGIEQD